MARQTHGANGTGPGTAQPPDALIPVGLASGTPTAGAQTSGDQTSGTITLSAMTPDDTATVLLVRCGRFGEGLAIRLAAMGVVPGRCVRLMRRAPFGGPLVVRVGATTEIAIRRDEAALIDVMPANAASRGADPGVGTDAGPG